MTTPRMLILFISTLLFQSQKCFVTHSMTTTVSGDRRFPKSNKWYICIMIETSTTD